MSNMKNTWNGINNLIDSKKVKSRVICSIKCPNDNVITDGPHEISNIISKFFTSIGEELASPLPRF